VALHIKQYQASSSSRHHHQHHRYLARILWRDASAQHGMSAQHRLSRSINNNHKKAAYRRAAHIMAHGIIISASASMNDVK